MGSSGKKRTTMAKLNREGRLREKRVEKEARKAARKLAATHDPETGAFVEPLDADSSGLETEVDESLAEPARPQS